MTSTASTGLQKPTLLARALGRLKEGWKSIKAFAHIVTGGLAEPLDSEESEIDAK